MNVVSIWLPIDIIFAIGRINDFCRHSGRYGWRERFGYSLTLRMPWMAQTFWFLVDIKDAMDGANVLVSG